MKRIAFLLSLFLFVSALDAQQRYITTSDGVRLYVDVRGKERRACTYTADPARGATSSRNSSAIRSRNIIG